MPYTRRTIQKIDVSGGTSLGMVLFLIFISFKLTGIIDWSWWWITAPLWVPLVLWLLAWGILILIIKKLKG